jgi:putative methyltransferase
MTRKNIYLWAKSVAVGKLIPTLWFSTKTYFEERGENPNQWNWADPFIHDLSDEALFEECEKNPPDVFGFSLYIWNHKIGHRIAQEVRRRWPKCLIIYGGPQMDIKYNGNFFKEKPWVDLVVPSDVYGEPVLTAILNTHDDLKPQNIPEVYYPRAGMKLRSKIALTKREYVWPKDIYLAQEDTLKKMNKKNSMAIYESTRGCPYRCSYCDWGGGTYTKVIRKPMETIRSELETLSRNGIEGYYFTDANFGIFKDDIDIIKYVAELKKKNGTPYGMSAENAKHNLKRVIDIQRVMISNNLSSYYKISIQNPHDDIKKNIDRVDIPFEDQIEAVRELKKEYPAPILIETILGLPGDSYQRTLEAIDLFHVHDIESFRPSIWNLLPEAPAYDPAERERLKIKSKWFEIYTWPFRYKAGVVGDQDVRSLHLNHVMELENVIETYSYDKFEWCDMLTLTTLGGIAKIVGFNFLTEYLHKTHGLATSVFYDLLYKEILKKKQFHSDTLNDKLGSMPEQLYKLVDDEDAKRLEFDIDPDFPMWLSPHTYVSFILMLHAKDFFATVGEFFSKKTNDNSVKDLCYYLGQIMIDIDYDPKQGRQFTTKYNWYSYLNNNEPLVQGQYDYDIQDRLLKFVGTADTELSDYPRQKNKIEKMKQFFYHRGSNSSREKYATNIKETKKERSTVDSTT